MLPFSAFFKLTKIATYAQVVENINWKWSITRVNFRFMILHSHSEFFSFLRLKLMNPALKGGGFAFLSQLNQRFK